MIPLTEQCNVTPSRVGNGDNSLVIIEDEDRWTKDDAALFNALRERMKSVVDRPRKPVADASTNTDIMFTDNLSREIQAIDGMYPVRSLLELNASIAMLLCTKMSDK